MFTWCLIHTMMLDGYRQSMNTFMEVIIITTQNSQIPPTHNLNAGHCCIDECCVMSDVLLSDIV